MDFRIEVNPVPLEEKIDIRDGIFLIGSCFTEHITARLLQYKFRGFENPHGILFNPASICQSLEDCITGKQYIADDLIEDQGVFASWDFHGKFSHPDPAEAIQHMNQSVQKGHKALAGSKWVIITLGSSFVYQLGNGKIVANCHKAPASLFSKRMLSPEEVLSGLDNVLYKLRLLNPDMRIVFTVSPVRHLKDGFVENNRSKAVLFYAVHQLVSKFEKVYYFPAYELVVDDLRDYRFYAEDMVHPNYQATRYVWDKLSETCITPGSRQLIRELSTLQSARLHRPLHPGSSAHAAFLKKNLALTMELSSRHPFLDFTDELNYFNGKTSV